MAKNWLEKILHFLRYQFKPMRVHVYALCWNDAKLLPYFFKHYDSWVEQYFIADNGSSDRSLEILKAQPNVSLSHFEVEGDSFVQAALNHYNQCWKQSRGKADWVIICNIDEHLYHPNWQNHLRQCTHIGITLLVATGYDMISKTFPQPGQLLAQTIPYGIRHPLFDKPQMFNPDAIQEINFSVGRHTADPSGVVVTQSCTELKLLHYKHLSLEYFTARNFELGNRMRVKDIENQWGGQYHLSLEAKKAAFEQVLKEAVRVVN